MAKPLEIPCGYIILSRNIFEGDYACRPPWEFKLWVWMLAEANHQPKRNGQNLDRGQLFTTLEHMQNAVAYWVGARKVVPGKSAIAKFLRRQREGHSVETSKTTRGIIITICQYDRYQTASNYERHAEGRPKDGRRTAEVRHYRQEGKKEEGKKKKTALAAKPPAEYRQFIDYFCEKWSERHGGTKFPFMKGKHGAAAASIWKHLDQDLERVKGVVDRFLANDEKFYAGHDLAKLGSSLAVFIAAPVGIPANEPGYLSARLDKLRKDPRYDP